jgi:hypothetical protein
MNEIYQSDVLISLADSLNNLLDASNGDASAVQSGLWYYLAAQGMTADYAFLNFDRASAAVIYQHMKDLSPSLRLSQEQFLSACDFEFGLLGN